MGHRLVRVVVAADRRRLALRPGPAIQRQVAPPVNGKVRRVIIHFTERRAAAGEQRVGIVRPEPRGHQDLADSLEMPRDGHPGRNAGFRLALRVHHERIDRVLASRALFVRLHLPAQEGRNPRLVRVRLAEQVDVMAQMIVEQLGIQHAAALAPGTRVSEVADFRRRNPKHAAEHEVGRQQVGHPGIQGPAHGRLPAIQERPESIAGLPKDVVERRIDAPIILGVLQFLFQVPLAARKALPEQDQHPGIVHVVQGRVQQRQACIEQDVIFVVRASHAGQLSSQFDAQVLIEGIHVVEQLPGQRLALGRWQVIPQPVQPRHRRQPRVDMGVEIDARPVVIQRGPRHAPRCVQPFRALGDAKHEGRVHPRPAVVDDLAGFRGELFHLRLQRLELGPFRAQRPRFDGRPALAVEEQARMIAPHLRRQPDPFQHGPRHTAPAKLRIHSVHLQEPADLPLSLFVAPLLQVRSRHGKLHLSGKLRIGPLPARLQKECSRRVVLFFTQGRLPDPQQRPRPLARPGTAERQHSLESLADRRHVRLPREVQQPCLGERQAGVRLFLVGGGYRQRSPEQPPRHRKIHGMRPVPVCVLILAGRHERLERGGLGKPFLRAGDRECPIVAFAPYHRHG